MKEQKAAANLPRQRKPSDLHFLMNHWEVLKRTVFILQPSKYKLTFLVSHGRKNINVWAQNVWGQWARPCTTFDPAWDVANILCNYYVARYFCFWRDCDKLLSLKSINFFNEENYEDKFHLFDRGLHFCHPLDGIEEFLEYLLFKDQ